MKCRWRRISSWLLAANTTPLVKGNDKGQIIDGSIHLRGKLLIDATVDCNKNFTKRCELLLGGKRLAFTAIMDLYTAKREGGYYLLPINQDLEGKLDGLILKPAKNRPRGYYERRGKFTVLSDVSKTFPKDGNGASNSDYYDDNSFTIVLV